MRASLVLLFAVPACLPDPIYKVQRTARVPHPAAPLRSGAPLEVICNHDHPKAERKGFSRRLLESRLSRYRKHYQTQENAR